MTSVRCPARGLESKGENQQAGQSASRRPICRPTACETTKMREKAPLVTKSSQPHVVQSLAVVSECHQGPLRLHLLQSAQQKPPESHRLLDDPEHRLHRLFPQAVVLPAFVGRHLLPHAPEPVRLRFPDRFLRRRRPKIVLAPTVLRPDRHHIANTQVPVGRPLDPANRRSRWRSSKSAAPESSADGIAPTPCPARSLETYSSEPAPRPPAQNARDRLPAPNRECPEEADTVGRGRARQISASRKPGRWHNGYFRKSMPKSDSLLAYFHSRLSGQRRAPRNRRHRPFESHARTVQH